MKRKREINATNGSGRKGDKKRGRGGGGKREEKLRGNDDTTEIRTGSCSR